MKRNLFFDLDGTIIDISEKYKYVFRKITNLGMDEAKVFWKLRRQGIPSQFILERYFQSPFEKSSFNVKWIELVENQDALKCDSVFEKTRTILDNLIRDDFRIILCTARRNEQNTRKQLEELRLQDTFDHVILTAGLIPKSQAIRSLASTSNFNLQQDDWIIGDTLEDIQAGFEMGISRCGILTGLTPKSLFEGSRLMPFPIVDKLSDFVRLL